MPIVVTFDFAQPRARELNRIRGAFERLGWESVGNTAYRYPRLQETPPTEDWINRVVPALMLLRALARHTAVTGRELVRLTIDTQTSTGFNQERDAGLPALPADEIDYSRPSSAGEDFARRRLEDWLDSIEWPYAPEENEGA